MNAKAQDQAPYIPENSPFTPEQRMYLNGFFAGIFSRTIVSAIDLAPQAAVPAKPLKPLTILFGSQTGTAEGLARKVAAEAGKRGFVPNVIDLAQYRPENLRQENRLLLLTSTYGDGDPPDGAKGFWTYLQSGKAPRLSSLEYSVLGLGDTAYQKFCQCAKDFDRLLESLGGRRIYQRVDCDVDDEGSFHGWLDGALPALDQSPSRGSDSGLATPSPAARSPEGSPPSAPAAFSRKNPFPSRMLAHRKLNGEGSAKDTRHIEISLEGSGLRYEAGDALGVMPSNCSQGVDELLAALGRNGTESVFHDEKEIPLREALRRHYEINKIPAPFLQSLLEKTGDARLADLVSSNGNRDPHFHGVIDLLLEFPKARFECGEFLKLLKPLQPRLYSISSSPKAHRGEAHLTVGVVRYSLLGRPRKGVCSTFLADRVTEGVPVPVFVHTNKSFRPPTDPSRPMIMVGPGTGVAPFRAFLEDRRAMGAPGKNWLFFGDQRSATDFLYEEELKGMVKQGVLARLDTAFSRDQDQKTYVQHRMLEQSHDLYAWLEEGAAFYVCGDALRMAKDVDQALHQVVQKSANCSVEKAAEYIAVLKAQKRYQRDVY